MIVKNFPNAFAKTGLGEYLEGLGETGKKIVLVGYMAHICVSSTARAGNELGYEVVIVGDAVGDRNIPGVEAEELVKVVLAEFTDGFGTVIQSGEIGV